MRIIVARGQLSIETLLIAAALLAFLAFLLPVSSKVFDSLRAHSVESGEQAVFDEIAFKAREASLLGPGTRFSFNPSLEADSEISFDDSASALKLDYWFAGKKSSLKANLSTTLFFSPPLSSNLSAGKYVFYLYNNGSGVVFSAQKQS